MRSRQSQHLLGLDGSLLPSIHKEVLGSTWKMVRMCFFEGCQGCNSS